MVRSCLDSERVCMLTTRERASGARVITDKPEIARVWKMTHRVWWRGEPTDPNVCVLRIEPQTAELWDGPASTALTVFELAKAWLTGAKPALGENRKATVNM
jgi:hypothetical protein